MMTTPMIATNTNNPAIAGTKYRSDADGGCVGCGVAVATGSITVNAAVVDDGQYPSVPAKVATTW